MKSLLAAIVALTSALAVGCAHAPVSATGKAGDSKTASMAATLHPDWDTWVEIASFTTAYHVEEVDRAHNVAVAAAKLNGKFIETGAAFSFNKVVGDRTLEAGYRNAPTLTLDGREPALGGGVCQVSSTTYNALLLADLALVERHAHSRAVHYLAMGRDAAVAFGSKDLKFVNSRAVAVRIEAKADRGRLTIRVLSPEPLDHEVRLEVGEKEPAVPRNEYQILENPEELAVGGYWVRLYRKRVRDGSTQSLEPIARTTFYPFKRRQGPR